MASGGFVPLRLDGCPSEIAALEGLTRLIDLMRF